MYDDLMKKKAKGIRGGIYTEDSGLPPPDEPDMGSSPPPKKKPKKMAKGGSSNTPQFKVPIQKLPYMGEKPEARTPPPAQRSKTNADVKMPEKDFKGGGMTASSRADGIAQRGKTRGKMC